MKGGRATTKINARNITWPSGSQQTVSVRNFSIVTRLIMYLGQRDVHTNTYGTVNTICGNATYFMDMHTHEQKKEDDLPYTLEMHTQEQKKKMMCPIRTRKVQYLATGSLPRFGLLQSPKPAIGLWGKPINPNLNTSLIFS
jgi:hypothetical protein